jgi:hypothetical protein
MNPKIWVTYLIIIILLLLSTSSYSYWAQYNAVYNDVILQSDIVTYFNTFLFSDNEEDLLFAPIAKNDSLADNNLLIQTDGNIVERTVKMTLLCNAPCDIKINYLCQFKNTQQQFINLPDGVLSVGLWCDFDIYDSIEPMVLTYNTEQSGYFVENFQNEQTGNLILKIKLVIADELIDPMYKQADYKIILSFEVIK